MKTALVVDTDLGFLFWLAGLLAAAGYQAYPAESVADAELLLNRIEEGIELLVVDPRLYRAADLAVNLRQIQPSIIILALEPESGASSAELPGVKARLVRPDPANESSTLVWRENLLKHLTGADDNPPILWQ